MLLIIRDSKVRKSKRVPIGFNVNISLYQRWSDDKLSRISFPAPNLSIKLSIMLNAMHRTTALASRILRVLFY